MRAFMLLLLLLPLLVLLLLLSAATVGGQFPRSRWTQFIGPQGEQSGYLNQRRTATSWSQYNPDQTRSGSERAPNNRLMDTKSG